MVIVTLLNVISVDSYELKQFHTYHWSLNLDNLRYRVISIEWSVDPWCICRWVASLGLGRRPEGRKTGTTERQTPEGQKAGTPEGRNAGSTTKKRDGQMLGAAGIGTPPSRGRSLFPALDSRTRRKIMVSAAFFSFSFLSLSPSSPLWPRIMVIHFCHSFSGEKNRTR